MLSAFIALLAMVSQMITGSFGYASDLDSDFDFTTANTQRRQDMARILSSFADYQSNNNGKLPTTDVEVNKFISRYIDTGYMKGSSMCSTSFRFCDPVGKPYVLNAPVELSADLPNALGDNPTFSTQNHEIHYYLHAACGGNEGSLRYTSGVRDMAIMYVLDDNSIYCIDNQ